MSITNNLKYLLTLNRSIFQFFRKSEWKFQPNLFQIYKKKKRLFTSKADIILAKSTIIGLFCFLPVVTVSTDFFSVFIAVVAGLASIKTY